MARQAYLREEVILMMIIIITTTVTPMLMACHMYTLCVVTNHISVIFVRLAVHCIFIPWS
jgi:hypothetical protein